MSSPTHSTTSLPKKHTSLTSSKHSSVNSKHSSVGSNGSGLHYSNSVRSISSSGNSPLAPRNLVPPTSGSSNGLYAQGNVRWLSSLDHMTKKTRTKRTHTRLQTIERSHHTEGTPSGTKMMMANKHRGLTQPILSFFLYLCPIPIRCLLLPSAFCLQNSTHTRTNTHPHTYSHILARTRTYNDYRWPSASTTGPSASSSITAVGPGLCLLWIVILASRKRSSSSASLTQGLQERPPSTREAFTSAQPGLAALQLL
ncbi:MAG: hypothetical protein BYD32DRAFT_241246 [Podila humilis]|nr:MAG: hypothetical protein BYD32DRAFT_241246 [Podila humilis]